MRMSMTITVVAGSSIQYIYIFVMIVKLQIKWLETHQSSIENAIIMALIGLSIVAMLLLSHVRFHFQNIVFIGVGFLDRSKKQLL